MLKKYRIASLLVIATAPAARAATPVIASGLNGFEGREEPAEIYFPSTNTFASDSWVNMIDEGGGMIRSTLRNYYSTLGWWDGDRTTGNTDRQRAEVKGINGLAHQKVGDTFEYSFDFRTNSGFTATSRFCHIFQLKATDGNDGPPLVTVTLRKDTSVAGQVKGEFIESSDGAVSGSRPTFTFTSGQWHHAVVRVTTCAEGQSTGALLLSINGGSFVGYTNQPIFLTGSTDYRPKWGLYRGIGVADGVPAGDSYVEHRTVTGYAGSSNLLTWKGGLNSNAWDTATTANFLNGAASATFNTVDQVNFDNSGSANTSVSLVGSVAPGYVRVNSSANYTFAGSGSLTGGTLRKDGTGVLTLATSNSYPGLTDVRAGTLYVTGSIGNNSLVSITGGTLRAGSNSALGSNSTIGTQINGGALDINGFNLTTEPVFVQAGGVGGAGAIVNNGGSQTSALTKVTLTGSTTFGGTGRWDIRGSGASLSTGGNAYSLTKNGANQVSLVAAAVDPALGGITISQGVLAFQTSSSSMGDPTKLLTVSQSGVLGLFNTSNVMNKVCTLDGGTIWGESGTAAQNTFAGPITLTSKGGIVDAGSALTGASPTPTAVLSLTGPIGSSGSLTKNGPGTVTLSGANSFTGGLVVSGGVLVAAHGDALGEGSLEIRAGAQLRAAASLPRSLLVKSLSIASGGVLDLANDSIVIDYTTTTPAAAVRQMLIDGRIRSSSASASATTGLGYADTATDVVTATGRSLDNSAVLVKYTFLGDANLDSAVDVNDLAVLATHWQQPGEWADCDFNYDGTIDAADLALLGLNWQAGVPGGAGPSLDAALAALDSSGLNVPEPAAAFLILTITLLPLTQRRLR